MENPPTNATCADCGSALDIELCTVCKEPICPSHRMGTGRLKHGYQCKERDCWYVGYPDRQRLEALQAMKAGAALRDAKASERAACEFFEALLKVEYPGRRVAVTPAPFADELPEDVAVQLDGSGVLDVTVGSRDDDPAWACFRCAVQFEVTRRDWLAAARVLLEKAKHAFEEFRAKAGLPPAVNEADKAVSNVVQILQEAARRANWDAQQGPDHLRTGRFSPTSREEPGKG